MQESDFSFKMLEKLSEIKEVLAANVTEQKHLIGRVDKAEIGIIDLKDKHDNCKARKRSDGFLLVAKDITILIGAVSAILAFIKLVGLR